MTLKEIKAIEKLAKKATPGPWWAQREYDGGRTVCRMRHQTETVCVNKASHVKGDPWDAHLDNANLIQELRNNADALCALAKEALELREALEWLAKHDAGIEATQHGYRAWRWPRVSGEGSTPLEAIQKARGKK